MSTNDSPTVESLPECQLLSGLDAEERSVLLKVARSRRVPVGTRIFELQEDATAIYIVRSGVVALTLPLVLRGTRTELALETRGEGSIVGWSGLVKPYRRTFGARADTEVELVCFERSLLQGAIEARPRIQMVLAVNLTEVIADRVAILETWLLKELECWATENS